VKGSLLSSALVSGSPFRCQARGGREITMGNHRLISERPKLWPAAGVTGGTQVPVRSQGWPGTRLEPQLGVKLQLWPKGSLIKRHRSAIVASHKSTTAYGYRCITGELARSTPRQLLAVVPAIRTAHYLYSPRPAPEESDHHPLSHPTSPPIQFHTHTARSQPRARW
jgi:hypothetical protein